MPQRSIHNKGAKFPYSIIWTTSKNPFYQLNVAIDEQSIAFITNICVPPIWFVIKYLSLLLS